MPEKQPTPSPEGERPTAPAEVFTLPAFAKINLSLRVLGRRPDGYHEIETTFQTVTLYDRLTFEPHGGDGFELVCDAPGVPADDTNLVARAALALRERFGVRSGARVRLEKNVPDGGGLGGGSSDAAVALVGLASLWKLDADGRELAELGARLGADVPFFLTGGTALGTGTGAEITPLADAPAASLVVVSPGVKVSTAEAYKSLNAPALTKEEAAVNLPSSRARAQFPHSLCEVMRNDFEPVVFGLRPEIERARESLTKAGARCALLAGSGSSVFGVFDSGEAARRGLREVTPRAEAGWRVFACETLSRAAYREAFGARAAYLLRKYL
ncbi:MAG TPA: 4-(cytidine 5'-diphospho)-2-C-methyl-D-erythritol kinase [Pyrinomonadaceae bacterium]|nr:4-(cytidine 5'-diphospho)-2-C-methyl-D-erythritol kinase [Pyrinomonadaceae bacterium]